MLSPKSIRIASYIIITYILVAISWWGVLLYREHDALYDAYEIINENKIQGDSEIIQHIKEMTPGELYKKRQRKSIMILSEAIFIGIGLLIGLFVINNGYRKLVKAEKLKQNFLLSISHELKSPIASTKLAFESLLRFNDNDDTSRQIASQGLSETNRLHDLVKNILLATRLDTGYLPEFKLTKPLEATNKIIQGLSIQYPEADVTLSVEPMNTSIMIDRQAFDMIMNNLIENAIKYSPGNSPVSVNINYEKHELEISISDLGLGIPDAEKSNVFDRFYRIGEEKNRKSKGTGLGLYLVKELIKINKGTISIHDNQPQGSIFRILWPIEPATLQS